MLSKFLKQSSIDISCCRSSDHISCRCCFPPFRLDLVRLENNEWGHSQPNCTHALCCSAFFPTHSLEGTFTGGTYNSCRLWYIAYAALVDIPYSIWGVIQPPGVQPFFVLLEKLRNLCWIRSNCTHNRQVYSHLLPHFRELLVEALQPIPPCSPLHGAKSSLTIPDCDLIGKYSQLILGKREPSSHIDHDGFHQASFLFYFREEIKEVGGYINDLKDGYPLITHLKLVKVTSLNLPGFRTFAVRFPLAILPL